MIKQEIKNKERYDLIHSNEYQIGFEEGRQDGITDTEKILKEQYETEQKSKEEGGLVNNYNRGFIDGQNFQKEKDLKDEINFLEDVINVKIVNNGTKIKRKLLLIELEILKSKINKRFIELQQKIKEQGEHDERRNKKIL